MHACVYADNVSCLLHLLFSLVFEAGSLTEPDVGRFSWPGWTASPGDPPGSACPALGITGTAGSYVGAGNRTQVLMLDQQALMLCFGLS